MIQAKFTGTINDREDGDRRRVEAAGRYLRTDAEEDRQALRAQAPADAQTAVLVQIRGRHLSAKITLAGTLTIPEGKGPFPAAILITGSRAQDRDETILGHKPFAVIADALTKRGIAVLRVDDRGIGKSTGSMSDSTSEDFATDVASGITYLKTRPEIDAKAIGLIGHSEGGIIGPMVAARSPGDVAYLVLLAGTGVNGAEILRAQSKLILEAAGADAAAVVANRAMLDMILGRQAATENDAQAAEAKVDAATLEDPRSGQRLALLVPEAEHQAARRDNRGRRSSSSSFRSSRPGSRFFLTFEPEAAHSKVPLPRPGSSTATKDFTSPLPGRTSPRSRPPSKSGSNDRITIKELAGPEPSLPALQDRAPPPSTPRSRRPSTPPVLTLPDGRLDRRHDRAEVSGP